MGEPLACLKHEKVDLPFPCVRFPLYEKTKLYCTTIHLLTHTRKQKLSLYHFSSVLFVHTEPISRSVLRRFAKTR